MINRILAEKLKKSAAQYPVITLTGPRQSGKTTLVKAVFPQSEYISMENPDNRAFALEDPRGFLSRFKSSVILDEVQRTPALFSYIHTMVDKQDHPGQFILTGSQNFLLVEQISQSLAGRTAIHFLLPFSKSELFAEIPVHPDDFPGPLNKMIPEKKLWEIIHSGFYPRIHDKGLDAQDWLAGYYQTYIERDVRSLINIGDLETFGKFVRLCAGRAGQLVNFSSLAADCGISNMTAKRWLSVLQASFIIAVVPPYYQNFNKRLIKSPKIYFLDTGLLCQLLGIRQAGDLHFHAQKGVLFESFVFGELFKSYHNFGLIPDIYFWHDVKRNEVDFLLVRGGRLLPIEVKSGETLTNDQFKGLEYFRKLVGDASERPVLIYAGEENYIRQDIQVMSWYNI